VIVHDLEAEHRERLGVPRQAKHFGAGIHVDALDRLTVDRRGQIRHHCIEQRLHALVLECRTTEHGDEGDVPDGLADETLQRREIRLDAIEVGRHDIVVEFDRGLEQGVAIFLRLLQQLGGNFFVVVFRAEALVFPDDGLHAQ
jgi:hypothetical protein